MGLESNGVMHKRWIRNEGKSETEWGRDDCESRNKLKEKNKLHGKDEAFRAGEHFLSANRISAHDAKRLKRSQESYRMQDLSDACTKTPVAGLISSRVRFCAANIQEEVCDLCLTCCCDRS